MSPGTLRQTITINLLLALLLFGGADTFAWPQGWAFLALFNLGTQLTGLWLRRHDPGLLAERQKTPMDRGQKPGERIGMAVVFLVLFGWLAFMALDARRFGWSQAPLWFEALGAVMIATAFYAWIGVLRANSFASARVRIQTERNQTVATTGPYAVVRHPMYAYTLLFLFGIPLLLGSLWGIPGALIFIALLVPRTLGEEALLFDDLPGYREYAARVRYRLVPGIW